MLLWRNEIQIQDFLDAAVQTRETIHQTSSKMTIMTMINFPRVQPGHQTVFLLTACMMIISTMMMHLFLLDLHESHLYRQDQLAVLVNPQDYLQHQASPEYQEMYMTDYPSLQQAPPTATPRPNVNFRLSPPRNRDTEPLFQLPRRPAGDSRRAPNRSRGRPGSQGLFVTSDLDILDQTKLFSSMDPNQEQFIRAPRLNAGALPLAFEAPDSNNTPFFPPLPPIIDGP